MSVIEIFEYTTYSQYCIIFSLQGWLLRMFIRYCNTEWVWNLLAGWRWGPEGQNVFIESVFIRSTQFLARVVGGGLKKLFGALGERGQAILDAFQLDVFLSYFRV